MKKAKNLSAWFKRAPPFIRHRFSEPHFRPYAVAIGELILAWNDLHERLAGLFAQAMIGSNVKQSFGVWHKTRADQAKRNLLKAAITNIPDRDLIKRPTVVKEIAWILEVADKLEGLRDDSVHGPLTASWGILERAIGLSKPIVTPNTYFGNQRAHRLKQNEDILRDFKYAKRRILILRDYVLAIDTAWLNVNMPWPDRPELPDRNSNRQYKGSAKHPKKK
jgi:hypothetical protein